MVIQRENNPFITAQDERVLRLTNADEAGHARQPVLALHTVSMQRKYQH
jgi:hypothetical protein